MFEKLLDDGYLFNRDEKRVRGNIRMFLIFMFAAELINGAAALADKPRASVLVALSVPLTLIAYMFVAERNIKSTKALTAFVCVLVCTCFLGEMFLLNSGTLTLIILTLYPIPVCFFLGNKFGIPLSAVLFANILFYVTPLYVQWRETINVLPNYKSSPDDTGAAALVHFALAFALSAGFGAFVEHIHNRTIMHLTVMANRITENSYRDPLTQLFARRAFYERYSEEAEAVAAAGNTQMFLVMCDVDHFKAVNDTYGHAIGDEILKHVSKHLREGARTTRFIFRWGGEEFLMVLPEQSLEKAVAAANRIRVVLEHTPYIDATLGSIKVTMSFGVSRYDPKLTMDRNISKADEFLYAAKHNGRNRVEFKRD